MEGEHDEDGRGVADVLLQRAGGDERRRDRGGGGPGDQEAKEVAEGHVDASDAPYAPASLGPRAIEGTPETLPKIGLLRVRLGSDS